jgi:hypothetical protein
VDDLKTASPVGGGHLSGRTRWPPLLWQKGSCLGDGGMRRGALQRFVGAEVAFLVPHEGQHRVVRHSCRPGSFRLSCATLGAARRPHEAVRHAGLEVPRSRRHRAEARECAGSPPNSASTASTSASLEMEAPASRPRDRQASARLSCREHSRNIRVEGSSTLPHCPCPSNGCPHSLTSWPG